MHEASPNPRFLLLALDSRRAIDKLLEFSSTGIESEEFKRVLADLAETLNVAEQGGDAMKLLSADFKNKTFSYYEDLLALQEVKGLLRGTDIESEIHNILNEKIKREDRQSSIDHALEFFQTLERCALRHYGSGQMTCRA